MANEKKGLKEFIQLVSSDKEVLGEVEKAENDTAQIVKIAKKHGCEFTEDEYNDLRMEAVTGGSVTAAVAILTAVGGLIGVAAPFVIDFVKVLKGQATSTDAKK